MGNINTETVRVRIPSSGLARSSVMAAQDVEMSGHLTAHRPPVGINREEATAADRTRNGREEQRLDTGANTIKIYKV